MKLEPIGIRRLDALHQHVRDLERPAALRRLLQLVSVRVC